MTRPDARVVTPAPTEQLGCEPGGPAAHLLPSGAHEPRITLTRTNLRDDDEPATALPPPRWLRPYSTSTNNPTRNPRRPHRQLQSCAVGTAARPSILYQMVRLDFKKNIPDASRVTVGVTTLQVVFHQPLKEDNVPAQANPSQTLGHFTAATRKTRPPQRASRPHRALPDRPIHPCQNSPPPVQTYPHHFLILLPPFFPDRLFASRLCP